MLVFLESKSNRLNSTIFVEVPIFQHVTGEQVKIYYGGFIKIYKYIILPKPYKILDNLSLFIDIRELVILFLSTTDDNP
jgi:hypothetical protein